jgi:hypothetical protein
MGVFGLFASDSSDITELTFVRFGIWEFTRTPKVVERGLRFSKR